MREKVQIALICASLLQLVGQYLLHFWAKVALSICLESSRTFTALIEHG